MFKPHHDWRLIITIFISLLIILISISFFFWTKVKNEDLLPFIQWVYHEWLPRSDYETTTKPSFAIYESVDFIKLDNEYDFSFYVNDIL